MALSFYNTLTRRKEEFTSIEPGKVRLYTCGPTVYNYAHIGNLRSYIFADVLRRTLEYFGYEVPQVMNVTDVGHLTGDADSGEDKMELEARKEGRDIWEIARYFEEIFFEDIEHAQHRAARRQVAARPSTCPDMIALVEKLFERRPRLRDRAGRLFRRCHIPQVHRALPAVARRQDDRRAR